MQPNHHQGHEETEVHATSGKAEQRGTRQRQSAVVMQISHVDWPGTREQERNRKTPSNPVVFTILIPTGTGMPWTRLIRHGPSISDV
jgi:hypothetical protein